MLLLWNQPLMRLLAFNLLAVLYDAQIGYCWAYVELFQHAIAPRIFEFEARILAFWIIHVAETRWRRLGTIAGKLFEWRRPLMW